MEKDADFLEILGRLLEFQKNRTRTAKLLFLGGFVVLGVGVSAFYTLASLLIKWGFFRAFDWQLVDKPVETRITALAEVVIAFLAFWLIYYLLKRHLRRNVAPPMKLALESPEPHPGLIFLLSKYWDRNRSRFKDYDEIDLKAEDARWQLLQSNWGPLVIAVEHHAKKDGAAVLGHCWLICTKDGSAPQFEMAERIVHQFAGGRVRCHKREIEDFNDLLQVTECIERIYDEAAHRHDLPDARIIADFTGGNAVMSIGVVLAATQDRDRKIEYVRQDKSLTRKVKDAASGREIEIPLTAGEMREARILITVVSRPAAAEAS